ncbi:MAG TPA: trigger factor [Candidatus Saccharimonadia bacterium]|nr:trigger factor [Candidatus Saccharimonadia bacterium]
MQVSVENVSSLERKLTIRIPSERYESRVKEKIRELGQSVRLKGFRPGKVPTRVIEQRFGAQVRNEAMSDVIGSSFQEAVRKENLRPAVAPSIKTQPADKGEIEYVATFEVVPELGPIDVGSLEIVRTVAVVEDADIDRMIDTLRMQRKQWQAVEREAQPGDMVLFEYAAVADGKRHPATGRERVGTVVGSGAMSAELEQRLVGMKAGEDSSFELTFPANFRQRELAGSVAEVELHVVRVNQGSLPEIDEAFVASFGVTEGGVARFRQDVRANLERELSAALRGRLKIEVVEKLVAAHASLEVPKGMVEAEARAMLRDGQLRAERAGLEPPSSTEPFKPAAQKRVAAFLLISEIAKQNAIALDQRRVASELSSIASTYEEPEKVVELYSKDQELMNNLRNRVIEDQVAEWVAEHAKHTEQRSTFAQVLSPQAA